MNDFQRLIQEAVHHLKGGNAAAAESAAKRALLLQPGNFDALHLMGVASASLGNHEAAILSYRKALRIDGEYGELRTNLGLAQAARGDHEGALVNFKKAVSLKPRDSEAHTDLGNAQRELGLFDDALESYERALAINSRNVRAWSNRGSTFNVLKRHGDALACFERAVTITPDSAAAWFSQGITLDQQLRYAEALSSYEQALAIEPGHAEAWLGRGHALSRLDRHPDALASYERGLALKATYPDGWCNRGFSLHVLEKYDEALASYERALALNPDYADAWFNRGITLHVLKRYDEALSCHERTLALNANRAEAWLNRGVTLHNLRRYEEALASYERVWTLAPDQDQTWYNAGNTLLAMSRYDEAILMYDRAVASKPEHADAWYNRGIALLDQKRCEEAVASFERALELAPAAPYLRGTYLHAKMAASDWRGFDHDSALVLEGVRNGSRVATPLHLLPIAGAAAQRQCAEIYVSDQFPGVPGSRFTIPSAGDRKIRVGYFSSDFGDHAVSLLTAGMFEAHDRARFEIVGFSLERRGDGEMRRRLSKAFGRLVDLSMLGGRQASELVRSFELDIAVDLNGHTKGARTELFCGRAAPVQVSYLGFPGTMGAGFIDYIVGDEIVIPPAERKHYSEKVVYIPGSFQVNDSSRAASGEFARSDVGLGEDAFVFCCFNSLYKVTPAVFDIWLEVLRKIEGSVLWLVKGTAGQVQRLRDRALRAGISPDRLVFADPLPYSQYLSRCRLADLALDSSPFGGGTTTSDTLWCGVPVVTVPGDSFASRMSASLLNAVGLPELVTGSFAEYKALAEELAVDAARLSSIRQKLAASRHGSSLFDTGRFTRHLETAYREMVRRHAGGLPPDHIYVKA